MQRESGYVILLRMRYALPVLALLALPAIAQEAPKSADPATAAVIEKELVYQTRFGQLSDIRLLLDRGASPEQMNEAGWPLVTIAASRSDGMAVPVLRELIKRGADINQGGPSRMFPVIVAARRGDDELMDFLLYEALADFNVRDPNGVLASDVARDGGHDEMAGKMEKIQAERKQTIQAMYDPKRRDALLKEAVLSSCALAYLDYYYQSKQDKVPLEVQSEKIGEWRSRNSVATNDLQQIFRMPGSSILGLGMTAGKKLKYGMDALISNRNRRQHGFGGKGDLEKRCSTIADETLQESRDAAERAKQKAAHHNRRRLSY